MTEAGGPVGQHSGSRRGLRIPHTVLRAVFAAALVVIIVLIVIRVVNAPKTSSAIAQTAGPTISGTPSTTPVQTATGSPTATSSIAPIAGQPAQPAQPAPTKASTKPTFTSFSSTDSVSCSVPPAGDVPFSGSPQVDPTFTISWKSANADQAYIGATTGDASEAPYSQVDASGSFSYDYVCPQESVDWTVTLIGSDGSKVSKTAHITNTGYTG